MKRATKAKRPFVVEDVEMSPAERLRETTPRGVPRLTLAQAIALIEMPDPWTSDDDEC